MAAFAWLAALTLRGTVVLSVALGLGLLLRRSSAAARHRLLTLTALGLLVLPALPAVLPSVELPLSLPRAELWAVAPRAPLVVQLPPAPAMTAATAPAPASAPQTSRSGQPVPLARGPQWSPGAALAKGAVIVWLAGVVVMLVGLGRALRREWRLVAAARPLEGAWLETLQTASRSLGLARPVRLLASEEVETPLTGGWPRSAVLVPSAASSWDDERRLLVVQHELVHVARADGLRQLAWRVVGVLYWFHPLARLAEREARLAGEHASDETVVGLGTRPSTYARHLLEIAESLRPPNRAFASALPMVERSQLERRLVMILDTKNAIGPGRAAAVASLALLAGTVLAVAAAAPVRPDSAARGGVLARASEPAARSSEPARSTFLGGACMDRLGGSFSGTISDGPSGVEANGRHDGDFSLQHTLGDGQRLCARVHGFVRFDERTGAIRELPGGSSVLIETRAVEGRSQRMLVTEERGELRYQWWLNGASQQVDDAARAWLKDALEVVAAYHEIGEIQGQVGSLQGEIGSIQGEIGSLQGEIGQVQGEIGSLQGRIGSIQGERGSLQGEIGSHQGAIGSLEGARWSASSSLKQQIDGEIRQHEAEIRKLEAKLQSSAFSKRLSDAEAELAAFEKSSRGKIAELERQIDAIRSEDGIGKLEKQIDALHADDRIDEIKRRVAPTVERLKAQVRALGN
jgi:beta-lactamase regulating signal transducer with metallopeptidase domain/predicted  nucleic acid-binding Zn-ribbon protein